MRVAGRTAAAGILALASAAALVGAPALAGRLRVGGLDARPLNPTCRAPASGGPQQVGLVPAFGSVTLAAPTAAANSPVDSDVWYVTERQGRIQRVDAGAGSKSVALDLSSQVWSGGEGGMLGIALHPSFAQNGHVFVYYTVPNAPLDSIVARYTTSNGGLSFAAASLRIVMRIPQPWDNHLGGDIHFGPDGKLYIGLGDGANDPTTAQDPFDLHGKLLRIDVDAANPYAIPSGNPFAGGGGAREVYALGFRNPYRWSFDALTGALWLGDVGQFDFEEVDLVTAGGNYGWPDREGFHCRLSGCLDPDYLDPIFEYSHTEGCAVLGGSVYRGAAIPSLYGSYVFGDYCSLQIRSARPQGGGYILATLTSAPDTFFSFAEGNDGELLVLRGNAVDRIAPLSSPGGGSMPLHIADTGCVATSDPKKPASGLIPYDLLQPLWSDGASKERWLALPDGQKIHVEADGDFTLPPGSVTMKHFRLGAKLIETRFFVRHGDGSFGGYTYEWNDAQTDALRLDTSKQRQVAGQTWDYPSRAQCMQCHTPAAGFSLGLETAQLNRDFLYTKTSRTANQLATLAAIGLFDGPLPAPGALPRFEMDTIDHVARGYLHANCAGCHRPNGTTGSSMDLRYGAAPSALRICNVTPSAGDLGVAGAKLLLPEDPARSVLSLRAHAVGANQMPPLARRLVDEAGVAVLDAWIRAWPSCTGPDSEGDGVFDAADNCPSAFNPSQGDADGDGIGNACETACNDGVDNDGDLRADYPNDAGCLSAASTSERPACNDGVDNDGDGRTDGPLDIGCAGASGVRENPVCADGVDNDGDGRIDFDGGAWKNGGVPLTAADAQCAGAPTRGERNCGLGFELAPLLLGVRLLARRRRRR